VFSGVSFPAWRLPRNRVLLAGLLGSFALIGMSGAPAHAALLSTNACDSSTLAQPFLPWGDSSSYKLVPGGNFEGSMAGWTLTGGAKTVAGSEPFGATGSVGSSSLDLPAGASVQSPYTCVNAGYPTFRFFGRNNGLLSTVVVSVVYKLPLLGLPVAVPVGIVALTGNWQPTVKMLTASFIPGLLSGGTTNVALSFTALTGNSQIDDIFVDPRCRT
jgi:hypothetical protein